MENLKTFINEILNTDLKDITISGVRGPCEATKIKIRPVILKGNIVFQLDIIKRIRSFIIKEKKSACQLAGGQGTLKMQD